MAKFVAMCFGKQVAKSGKQINKKSTPLPCSAAVLNVFFNSVRKSCCDYGSAVSHTVSRHVNTQARVHQALTLECSEM